LSSPIPNFKSPLIAYPYRILLTWSLFFGSSAFITSSCFISS
jgi:hypothetical protein